MLTSNQHMWIDLDSRPLTALMLPLVKREPQSHASRCRGVASLASIAEINTVSNASTVVESTSVPNQAVSVTATQIPATLGQAVVPTVTDQASLTTQATQAVVSEARYADAQSALEPIQNPYPSQTPIAMLSRQYKVAEFDFTPTFTNTRISFPAVLFAQPVIAAAMLSFPFWRADVKVHIKMQSVPQQRGALMVSWLPCTNKAVTSKIEASGNHATILNVSTSDTCSFVIPYMSPKAWLQYPPTTATDHSSLYINTLVPLAAPTGISAVVKFTVYASFDNPRVAGFNHVDTAQSGRPSKKVVPKVNPLIQTISDITAAIEPAMGLLNLLDKPDMSVSNVHAVISNGGTIGNWQTDATIPSIPMSLKDEPYLANTVDLFPLGKSSDSFTALASNPMLCFWKEITANGDRIEYPVNPCVPATDGTNFAPDYLFHFTRFASYWRGSIRFFMHFCCDQFTSARFRIGLSYSAWSADWADSGDVPSVVVDVHGSTYYGVTIPYLQDEYWQRVVIPFTAGSVFQPKLIIEALEAPVGATAPASPKIVLSLFRAAGPDFQLAEPGYNVAYTPPTPPSSTEMSLRPRKKREVEVEDEAQCSLEGAFAKTFVSVVPQSSFAMETGMCMPEVMDSPAQLAKRVSELTTSSTLGGDNPSTIPNWYLNLTAQVFAFWRGSRRVQTAIAPGTSTLGVTTGILAMNPLSPVCTATSASITYVLPYYSTVPYRVDASYPYTGRPFTASVTWYKAGTNTTQYFRYFAGDDMVCGHLVAPNYQVDAPS